MEKASYILQPVAQSKPRVAGAIRAKSMCMVSACTRVNYSPAGFGQRLLAWHTSSTACTKSFCPNWSRLP